MKLVEGIDYIIDERSGYKVFTAHYHLKRGTCCGSGCKECPFIPWAQKGNKNTEKKLNQDKPS